MGKMIAKAEKGREFVYSRSSAHSVSEAGAASICAALNASSWGLKPGEVWHVYDCGPYEMEYTGAGYQAFARRSGHVYEKRI